MICLTESQLLAQLGFAFAKRYSSRVLFSVTVFLVQKLGLPGIGTNTGHTWEVDTVMAVKWFFSPLRIIWIKRLIFFHPCPHDMQKFSGGGTAGHFLGFTRFTQTRYYTDGWGAYERHLDTEQHRVGKDYTQKIESKHIRLRTRIKRLVRRTICFSKTERMHDLVIGLFIHRYEFGRLL
jgi:hypothetical protein